MYFIILLLIWSKTNGVSSQLSVLSWRWSRSIQLTEGILQVDNIKGWLVAISLWGFQR